jgi:hypothetical protein
VKPPHGGAPQAYPSQLTSRRIQAIDRRYGPCVELGSRDEGLAAGRGSSAARRRSLGSGISSPDPARIGHVTGTAGHPARPRPFHRGRKALRSGKVAWICEGGEVTGQLPSFRSDCQAQAMGRQAISRRRRAYERERKGSPPARGAQNSRRQALPRRSGALRRGGEGCSARRVASSCVAVASRSRRGAPEPRAKLHDANPHSLSSSRELHARRLSGSPRPGVEPSRPNFFVRRPDTFL